MSNNTIYLITVIVFMVVLAIIGIMISRGIKSQKDWMVAGKSLGIIPMAGTYFATIVSAASIISYMGYYYLNGWPGWWNCAGTFLTSFLACIWFAKRLRKAGCDTLPEYISQRFGSQLAMPAAFLVTICTIALLSAQIIGSVVVLQAFVDWDQVTCCIVLLVVFVAFTMIGGMKAVAWTDTICAFVIIIGVWVMAATFLGDVGGFTAMNEQIAAINPDFVQAFSESITPPVALSWLVTWGICNFGAPVFIARFFSAESPEVASRSQGITGIGLLLFYIPLIIIGLCGMLLVPGIESQDAVFVTLVTTRLPALAGGIMFAAVMAAIISTADSLLLLAAQCLRQGDSERLSCGHSGHRHRRGAAELLVQRRHPVHPGPCRHPHGRRHGDAHHGRCGLETSQSHRSRRKHGGRLCHRLRLVRTGPTRRCNGCPARSHRSLLGDGGGQQTDPSPSRRSHRQVLLRIGNRITGLSNFDSCATIQTDW